MQTNKVYKKALTFLSSKTFLYLIIFLFSIQALWIALSFRFPMIFDEGYHTAVIKIHASRTSPFISNQPEQYDEYGPLTTGSHGIYHYLMSFPYRFASLFVEGQTSIVVLLRLLNIAMAAVGLWLYSKLFRSVNIRQQHINVGLLFFVLLPIVPFVSAHVNYDNMLFPLTALYLIFAVRIVQTKKVVWTDYAWLVTVGCLASLVKFTFLPILAITGLYMTVVLYKRHKLKIFKKIQNSAKAAQTKSLVIVGAVMMVTLFFFAAMPIRNTLLYGSPTPACQKVIGLERCLKGSIAKRNYEARKTRDQRSIDIASFTVGWYERMTSFGNSHSNSTDGQLESALPPQTLKMLLVVAPILGIGGMLYTWRSLKKDKGWYVLIIAAVGLVASVYVVNASGYVKAHAVFANQSRYLLSVIPIFLVMTVVAYAFMLRQVVWAKFAALLFALLLFSQGGGVITHIVKSKDTWYWQEPKVIDANRSAKKILDPFVGD